MAARALRHLRLSCRLRGCGELLNEFFRIKCYLPALYMLVPIQLDWHYRHWLTVYSPSICFPFNGDGCQYNALASRVHLHRSLFGAKQLLVQK